MTCWRGETRLTFCENFAKIWIEKAQSQNVTGAETDEAYPDAIDADML